MTMHPKCSSLNELDSLCKEISEKANQEFDSLIKECNINLGTNKQWSNEYYSLVKANNKLKKKIKRQRVWRWILIIFLIFPFFLLTSAAKKNQQALDSGLIKEKDAKEKLDQQLAIFVSKLSYDLMFKKVIEPLWKDVKLDIYQDVESFKSWLPLMDKILGKDSCFTELLSGTIFDNPFMIYNFKAQTWYMHTYTGSIPVTYSTTDGQGHHVTRTEIVVATETLPAPQWSKGTELAYHFDKPSKLCFANNSSKHEMKKLVKKNKQAEMDNREFDKIFPATRSDEKDFRVVFTPLAQENYINLFKQQQYHVTKDGDVTIVSLPNQATILDTTDNEACNYDVVTWKQQYTKWVYNFVHSIGLLSLPIANIPLYTQFKTRISPASGKQVPSKLQAEENITHLFNLSKLWSQFDTDVIFQPLQSTKVTINKIDFNAVTVQCNYFWPDHKVIMKPGFSVHRGTVMVPIHVIYYRPRSKKYVVYQSINLNNSKQQMYFNDKLILHRGQLMFLSESSSLNANEMNAVKNALEKIKKA